VSLLNAYLSPDRQYALIGVDTESRDHKGEILHVTKLFTAGHIGAVLAARGVYVVTLQLAAQLACAQSFEHMARDMPAQIEQAVELARPVYMATGADEKHFTPPTVMLAGWFEGSIVVRLWNAFASDDPQYRVWDLPPGQSFRMPEREAMGRFDCSTTEGMEKTARRQIEFCRPLLALEGDPAVGLGGRLIVARMSAGRVSIEDRGSLDEPARSRPLFSFSVASA
jgi:hypothetical protein